MALFGYSAFESRLVTGCAILWKGLDPLSRAIRVFSRFSHASLVVRIEEYQGTKDQVFLTESLASGIELRSLWERIQNYNGQVFIFTPSWLTPEIQDKIGSFALQECAKNVPYSYGGLFANILGHVSQHARRWFCSQFVWEAYIENAPAINFKPTPKAPRPGDIPVWTHGTLDEIDVPRSDHA
jgi:uncharacterized protein YycO